MFVKVTDFSVNSGTIFGTNQISDSKNSATFDILKYPKTID